MNSEWLLLVSLTARVSRRMKGKKSGKCLRPVVVCPVAVYREKIQTRDGKG